MTANSGSIAGFLTIGASGGIYQGTYQGGHDLDPAYPETGLKIWHDTGIGRIAGYNTHVLQWYAGTDGKLYAGAGAVILDADGITLTQGSAAINSLKFRSGANTLGYMATSVDGSGHTTVANYAQVSDNSKTAINYLGALATGGDAYVRARSTATATDLYYNAKTHTSKATTNNTTAFQFLNASDVAMLTIDSTNRIMSTVCQFIPDRGCGQGNIFIGPGAGTTSASAANNIGFGEGALNALTSGANNFASGYYALVSLRAA